MKFSVIIPVYNAEKTLRRCVDSLLEQNCADAEIILVNDGSTDNSEALCLEYVENNDNVRYITQQNAGVSAARNTGLDAAVGEYVLFVDSDDYVNPQFFYCMEQNTVTENVDFAQFSGLFDNGEEQRAYKHKSLSVHNREELIPHIVEAICNKGINSPWANLYKRSIIERENIRFPVGASVAEDRAFNIVYSFYIQSYSSSEEIVYVVNTKNENSLSRKRYADLESQFDTAQAFINSNLESAPIPVQEKESYRHALNFGNCRGIYHDAKLMIQDRIGWLERQKRLIRSCKRINKKRMQYPKTRYCTMITLPVRLYLTPVIDAVARAMIGK